VVPFSQIQEQQEEEEEEGRCSSRAARKVQLKSSKKTQVSRGVVEGASCQQQKLLKQLLQFAASSCF